MQQCPDEAPTRMKTILDDDAFDAELARLFLSDGMSALAVADGQGGDKARRGRPARS